VERRSNSVGEHRLLRRKWIGRRFGLRQPPAADEQAQDAVLEARESRAMSASVGGGPLE